MESANDERTSEELIAEALRVDSEDDAYWDILPILWRRPTKGALLQAQQLCESHLPPERELGANILAQLGSGSDALHEERLQTLLELLESESDPRVLNAATVGLGHLHDDRAVLPLLRFKNHPSADVRFGMVWGLSGQSDERAIAALIELSTDVDIEVRDWATFRLGMLEETTPAVLDALVARLPDEDDETRAEAIVGLARRKDQRAIEPLIEFLNHVKSGEDRGHDYIGGLLYEAASELADPSLCPALLKLKSRIPDDEFLGEALESCGCQVE